MRHFVATVLVFGATGLLSCGPPPDPLSTETSYSEGCRPVPADMRPGCPGNGYTFSGAYGTGDPRLDIQCSVSSDMTRLRFRVFRGSTLDQSDGGLFFQGTLSGAAGNMTMSQGCGIARFRGSQSNVQVPGNIASMGTGCQVTGVNIQMTNGGVATVSGRFRCLDLPDDYVPFRYHFISGMGMEEGTFSFRGCTVGAVTLTCG